MKNFTLALAGLAIAMTASATDISTVSPLELQHKNLNRCTIEALNLGEAKAVDGIHSVLAKHSKAKKAASTTEVAGDYIFTLGDYYMEPSNQHEEIVDGAISFDEGFAILEWDYYPGIPAVGDYIESTGELDFFPINLGQYNFSDGGKYYVFCLPTVYNTDTDQLEIEEFSMTFNEETNSFDIPEDHGFIWQAYADENGEKYVGDIYVLDLVSAVKVMPDPNWPVYDTAYYVDGWMLPGLGYDDPEEYGWDVTVLQNAENPNLFRIDNPYRQPGCPLAPYGYAARGGYIEFDISDPLHVSVTPGIWNGMAYTNGTWIGNTNYYGYVLQQMADYSKEELIEYCESQEMEFSTYEDGYVYFEMCLFQENGEGIYIWDESVIDIMNGYLVFDNKIPDPTGQTKVAANVAEDGAVEFFNLQGVRVANPQAGQLVIKRQGDKASKIIVK